MEGNKIINSKKVGWDVKLGILKKYKAAEGHCQVPQHYVDPESGLKLGRWVANLRQRADFLTEQQCRDLLAVGFEWKKRFKVQPWDMKLELLKKFKQVHGHTMVSKDYVDPETKHRLGGWVDRLRQGRDKLLPHQKESLDALDFCWNAYEATWSTMFELLKVYREEMGHTKIKVSENYKEKPLGQWVGMQRQAYHKGKLQPGRKEQLESIGFVWSVRKTYRHENYDVKDVGESEENTKEFAVDDRSPPLKKKAKTEDGENVEEELSPTNAQVQQVEVTKAEEV